MLLFGLLLGLLVCVVVEYVLFLHVVFFAWFLLLVGVVVVLD